MEKETLLNYDHKHPLVQSAFIDLQGVLRALYYIYVFYSDVRYYYKNHWKLTDID